MMRLNKVECPKSFLLALRGFPSTQSHKQCFYIENIEKFLPFFGGISS